MHTLSRQVRFSINPFLPEDLVGANSFASRPAGQGLAVFFELLICLKGEVNPETGFVVNVTEIDKCVRKKVVPVFAEKVRADFATGRHIGFSTLKSLLEVTWQKFLDEFGNLSGNGIEPARIHLKLNPFRRIWIESKETQMFYFCEKFEFAATHKLWNDRLSERENFRVFGKCANPTGHGHNYIVEVAVQTAGRKAGFEQDAFETVVDDELIQLVDHKNLNHDISCFVRVNPTVENIASFAWERLEGRFTGAKLHSITVWETDKTFCTYYGPH